MNATPKQLAASTAISLGVASIVLIALVMPAEYGLDPLGVGEALGLTELSVPHTKVVSRVDFKASTVTEKFTLQPWESLEFKFDIVESGGLVYSWHASAPVIYEFHGEPKDGPEGFAETWNKGEGVKDSGTAMLPFQGQHGWFFENRSLAAVDVELTVSGFFEKTILYRDGFVTETPMAPSLQQTP